MQLNEPIMVKINEWNTGGLITRIEVDISSLSLSISSCLKTKDDITRCLLQGLRAFLPKIELMNRVNKYADLKNSVSQSFYDLFNTVFYIINKLT